MRLVIVQFCCRSGGHAVMNWIANGFIKHEFIDQLPYHKSNYLLHCTGDTNCLVVGCEDWTRAGDIGRIEDFIGDSRRFDSIHRLSLIRDPYNHIASRIQHMVSTTGDTGSAEKVVHEINAVGTFTKLVAQTEASDNYDFVSFNKWLYGSEYRKELSQTLGMDYKKAESHRWKVTAQGNGSSFTQRSVRNMEHEHLCNRYKAFMDNSTFVTDVVCNDEINRISSIYFPEIYSDVLREVAQLRLGELSHG